MYTSWAIWINLQHTNCSATVLENIHFIGELHGFITRRYYEINCMPWAFKITRAFGSQTDFCNEASFPVNKYSKVLLFFLKYGPNSQKIMTLWCSGTWAQLEKQRESGPRRECEREREKVRERVRSERVRERGSKQCCKIFAMCLSSPLWKHLI